MLSTDAPADLTTTSCSGTPRRLASSVARSTDTPIALPLAGSMLASTGLPRLIEARSVPPGANTFAMDSLACCEDCDAMGGGEIGPWVCANAETDRPALTARTTDSVATRAVRRFIVERFVILRCPLFSFSGPARPDACARRGRCALSHVGAKLPHSTAQPSAQQSSQCLRVGVANLARNCLDVVANRYEVPCPFDPKVLEKCQRRLAEHCLRAALQGACADGQCARHYLKRKSRREIIASPPLEFSNQRIGVREVVGNNVFGLGRTRVNQHEAGDERRQLRTRLSHQP